MIFRGYLCGRIESGTKVVPPCPYKKNHKYMDDNTTLQFSDKTVTFDQFVDSLATKVALRMHQVEKGQLEISQAQAYRMFGRADVDRWVKNGKLKPVRISPGKKRYRLVDLQELATIQQNYIL